MELANACKPRRGNGIGSTQHFKAKKFMYGSDFVRVSEAEKSDNPDRDVEVRLDGGVCTQSHSV